MCTDTDLDLFSFLSLGQLPAELDKGYQRCQCPNYQENLPEQASSPAQL